MRKLRIEKAVTKREALNDNLCLKYHFAQYIDSSKEKQALLTCICHSRILLHLPVLPTDVVAHSADGPVLLCPAHGDDGRVGPS